MSDPVRHVTNLRHECESDGCYRAELWDWTPFNDCFGNSGIRISDVDGIVERNAQFLMLDGKRAVGQRFIKDGPRRLYKAFASRGGHVVVFHGEPPRMVHFVRMWLPGGEFVPERPCDLDRLKAIVADWYTWADGLRQPTRSDPGRELRIADPPPSTDDGEWDDVVTVRPPDYQKGGAA